MKILLAGLTALLFLAGCGNDESEDEATGPEAAAEAELYAFFDDYNSGDCEAVNTHLGNDPDESCSSTDGGQYSLLSVSIELDEEDADRATATFGLADADAPDEKIADCDFTLYNTDGWQLDGFSCQDESENSYVTLS